MIKIKAHIIKLTAIIISLIYVLMPIHKEVKSTLHSVSHFFEMPNTMLSHNQNENLNYKFETPTIKYHQHKILDLLDAITDTNANTKDSNKPNIVDSKIDKHFHSSKYKAQKLIEIEVTFTIDTYKENVENIFYKKIKIPPKEIEMHLF